MSHTTLHLRQEVDKYSQSHTSSTGKSDLEVIPRPFTLDFPGPSIDQKSVDLALEIVGADPDGEEDVFERDVVVLRFF